jgi:hypothetical protein
VPALEPLPGTRIVASPDAIDRISRRLEGVIVLRFNPDEAFVPDMEDVEVDDPEAIVEVEHGLVGAELTVADFTTIALHVEWALPTTPSTLAQGSIAGVPAKLLMLPRDPEAVPLDDVEWLLITHAACAHDLADRLGWLP